MPFGHEPKDDRLRETDHGEPVELCAGYSLSNDSHVQLFMTLCIGENDPDWDWERNPLKRPSLPSHCYIV